MPAEFVPLLPPVGGHASVGTATAHVKVVPSSSANFQPLLTAKPSASTELETPPPANRATAVTCERDGERITKIVVQCACGERHELECSYP